LNYVLSVGESLGKGFGSFFISLDDGFDRTKIDVGLEGDEKRKESWADKAGLVEQIYKTVENHDSELSPAFAITSVILKNYYNVLPPEALEYLLKKSGLYAAHYAGRTYGAKYLTMKTAKILVQSLTVKMSPAVFLENPEGLAGTAIKIAGRVVDVFLLDAIFDSSAKSARYLKINYPKIYQELKVRSLEMLFFLIRKPLQKYLDAIRIAKLCSRRDYMYMLYKKWGLPMRGVW
jgi:hypothetical protein